MIRLAAGVGHAVLIQPSAQLGRQVGRSVIAEQPWALLHSGGIETGGVERQAQGLSDVGGGHSGTEFPGQDIAREVIEHGGQIERNRPLGAALRALG